MLVRKTTPVVIVPADQQDKAIQVVETETLNQCIHLLDRACTLLFDEFPEHYFRIKRAKDLLCFTRDNTQNIVAHPVCMYCKSSLPPGPKGKMYLLDNTFQKCSSGLPHEI